MYANEWTTSLFLLHLAPYRNNRWTDVKCSETELMIRARTQVGGSFDSSRTGSHREVAVIPGPEGREGWGVGVEGSSGILVVKLVC